MLCYPALVLRFQRLTFFIHLPFLHFKFLSSSPIHAPHYHHHTGCAHYSGFACLLQSSMRRDETELPVAASAELHSSDRKSSTLGPRHSQQTNADFLKGPYVCAHARTHNTKILPKTEFTSHSIQFKYIYMQEINWKTEVCFPAQCFSPCTLPIKFAQLRRMRPWVDLVCHPSPLLMRDHTPKTSNPSSTFSYVYVLNSPKCYCSQFVRQQQYNFNLSL